ncbi:MAG: type IX secretion system sortase PorU [Paludibacteraceae bacterium]|nr:type IX secretion system sortase PorU [Paludibacteraceae bacterium]
MKRLLTILSTLAIIMEMMAGTHSYADRSILSNGHFVKIKIAETGFYMISYDELKMLGLNPNDLRILGYGGEMLTQDFRSSKIDDLPSISYYIETGSDGVFNTGDHVIFYGKGPVNWIYKDGAWMHNRNPYADYGCYFLSDDAGEKRIISNDTVILNNDNAFAIYQTEDHQLHEQDLVNVIDINYGREGGGREWYGERINNGSPITISDFNFPNISSSEPMYCRVHAGAHASELSTFTITLGDQQRTMQTARIDASDFYTQLTTGVAKLNTAKSDSPTPSVKIQLSNTESGAYGYLNYVELTAKRWLKMTDGILPIRWTNSGNDWWDSRENNVYHVSGANDKTQVWNLTDPLNIKRVNTYWIGDTLCFVGSSENIEEYVAINPEQTKSLKRISSLGKIENQNLHGLKDIDLVIITNEELKAAAHELGEAHQLYDGLTYAVVTEDQVFNEFSSGTPDASAYRWLMKMLWDRAEADSSLHHPSSLLLMGDGTFDNRKILNTSGERTLLTYQTENSTVGTSAFAIDDYFTFMDDGDGMVGTTFYDARATMDLGVGRLPVNTAEQAHQVVNKLVAHMKNENKGRWKQELCFLADDGEHGLHTQVGDAAGELVRIQNPNFIVNKIYLDAYVQEASAVGERYPVAYNRFTNLMRNGVLMMDYSGHGSPNAICNEGFLSIADVKAMSNKNRGFWVLATCSYSHFDRAETCSAEEAILNPNGGAIGVYSASRTVYATRNDSLNRSVCRHLFTHTDDFNYPLSIGEAIRRAKNSVVYDLKEMAYILLGDPAIRLNYPTQFRVVTTTKMDTLNALSKQTVRGYIEDENGDTAIYFNGMLAITIFDKLQQVTTRDNDEENQADKRHYTYNDYTNRLFKGEAIIKDGVWEYEFMLPKDILYNYGNGRIVYYAYDSENGEGVGHKDDFIIGGSSNTIIEDNQGPDIRIYLNTPSFIYGGQTNERPHFYAELYDENGINTVGSGIGHDLLMVEDESAKMSYVLNDYYTADPGTYQSGQVSYSMIEQTEGIHSITFRAWDLCNNSNTAELSYEVVKGAAPTICSLITYPNPVATDGEVHIAIDYDQPDELLYADFTMADLYGHLICDLKDLPLDRELILNCKEYHLQPGIYAYRVQIHSDSTKSSYAKGKLIVY